MAYMLTRVGVEDYEAWKSMFDSDLAGARKQANGHRILRSVEDPNELFIQVEFPSPDDAKAARERLRESGVLDRVNLRNGPTVAEEAETVSY